jgi:hypothetical protein
MTADGQTVYYHPARTVVRIVGVVTEKTKDDLAKVREHTSDVSVATEADLSHQLRLVFPEKELLKRELEFDITLTPDERLSAAGVTTTGVGAEVLEAGVKVAAFVAPLAAAAFTPSATEKEGAPPPPTSVDDVFKEECPASAELRKSLRKAIKDLQKKFADEAQVFAGAPADKDDKLKALDDALAKARSEAGVLEAQFDAWRSQRFPPWSQKLSYALGVDELPDRNTAKETFELSDDEKQSATLAKTREAMDNLGVVVVWIGDRDDTADEIKTDVTDEIQFRRPRPGWLAVYEVKPPHPDQAQAGKLLSSLQFRLRSVTSAQVIDSHSAVGAIPFRSSLFARHGTAAEFGETGTLVRLSNKDVGALGILLGGAGGQASPASQASQTAAAKPAVSSPADPDLEALQGKVVRRELEVRLMEADGKVAQKDFEAPLVEADKEGNGAGK